MKIIFSKHAEMKIKERIIEKEEVEEVLKEPDFVFYGIYTKNFINVCKVKIKDVSTNLVVVYMKENDIIKIITVYPCKDIKRELRKKEGKRWIRVK